MSGIQKILSHLQDVVGPALRDYAAAEVELNNAHESKDVGAIESARKSVMRAARQAAIELHQFADLVMNEPTPTLPPFNTPEDVRVALRPHCRFLRKPQPIEDVSLLRDVAESFKHYKLNRQTADVDTANSILTLGSGWGEMHSGEGKYGGAEQVLVLPRSGGKRALSSILQNVFDAWLNLLGLPLPKINEF